MSKYQQSGMTMIELLVTITIVAVLAGVATPSLRDMMESNRMVALNNQLVSSLNYIRSEAVKRSYLVTMCVRDATGSACAGNGGFENGWLIFVDCNSNNAIDTSGCNYGAGNTNAAEEILMDVTPDMKGITITSNISTSQSIRYRPNGNASNAGSLTLNLNGASRYKVNIAPNTGRISSCKVGSSGC